MGLRDPGRPFTGVFIRAPVCSADCHPEVFEVDSVNLSRS